MPPTLERTTTRLASGLAFGEGPRWHGGRLWFSDMHGRQVMTLDSAGRLYIYDGDVEKIQVYQ